MRCSGAAINPRKNRYEGAVQVFLNNRYGFLKSMISATLSLEHTLRAREEKARPGRCGCQHYGEFLFHPKTGAPGGAGGPFTHPRTDSLAILQPPLLRIKRDSGGRGGITATSGTNPELRRSQGTPRGAWEQAQPCVSAASRKPKI